LHKKRKEGRRIRTSLRKETRPVLSEDFGVSNEFLMDLGT